MKSDKGARPSRVPRMLHAVLAVALAGGVAGAGRARAEPEGERASLDPSSWSRLPGGFLPGEGRVLLERDGRVLTVELPPSLDVENHEEVRVGAGGDIVLRLAGRGAGERGATMTILRLGTPGDRALVNAIVEARFRRLELAQPARFVSSPGAPGAREEEIVFLGLAGGGQDVARGLYDPTRDEGIDCGRIDRRFRFRLLPREAASGAGGAGGGVRISGSVPQGRELVLFDWKLRKGVIGARRERPLSTLSLHGWRLTGLSRDRLQRAVSELAAPKLLGGASYVEIGDGWQSRRSARALFAPIERDWLASLPADPALPSGGRGDREPGSVDSRGGDARSRDARDGGPGDAAPAAASARTPDRDGAERAESVETAIRSLREKGLDAGIWMVPHGQTSDAVFEERPDAFVRDRSGRSISGSFLGKYVVDPTGAAGEAYLRELSRRLWATGARVFRIGGLKRAILFYRIHRRALQNDAESAVEIVKRSLAVLRESAGDGVVLAGEYGTPEELAGELDTIRPAAGAGEAPTDLQREGLAASRWLPLHRRLLNVESFPLSPRFFVNDRDDLVARLRSYLHFTALTGRGIVLDGAVRDGAWEAPETVRVLLRETQRPADVYPLDVLRREKAAPIWVVKPSAARPDRSVIGAVNWSDLSPARLRLAASELGVVRPERGGTPVWFDLLGERFMGSGWQVRDAFLLPGHSRFFCVEVLRDVPRVLAVSGHVLGRELFLRDLRWDPRRLLLSGQVDVDVRGASSPAQEPERPGAEGDAGAGDAGGRGAARRVHIAVGAGLRPVQGRAEGGRADLEVTGGHVVLTIEPGGPGAVSSAATFRLTFERVPESVPANASARLEGLEVRYQAAARRPLLEWRMGGGHESWRSVAGFEVLRDGEVIGRTTDTRFLDTAAEWGTDPEYVVRTIGHLPDAAAPSAEIRQAFNFPDPEDTRLANVFPHRVEGHPPARSRSTTGGPLLVGGHRPRDGWGVRPPSRMDFRIDGSFVEFRSGLGVDDAARLQGSVVFVVLVDGREAYRSPRIEGDGREPREIRVDTRGAAQLSLIVEDAGDGADWDYADWCEPRLITGETPNAKSQIPSPKE